MQALNLCLDVFPIKLSPIQREDCDKLLTLDELANALSHMANEQAPRLDEILCEFYKVYWDFIGFDLYRVYLEAL